MQNRFIYNNDVNMTFRSYISKVFLFVAAGLLVSTLFALLVGRYFLVLIYALGSFGTLGLFLPIILELVVAIYFSRRLLTMKKTTAYICYFLYSALTGLSLSFILMLYDIQSIGFAFASTTLLFVCMSIIGHTTKIDLSRFTNYLFFGLLGIIIVTLLNSFIFKSAGLDLFVSYIAVIIFLVLIAFDMQRLRYLYNEGLADGELYEKLLIYGSFQLYLDFINLFLRLLDIFSRRRKN